jgi:AraC family transcriptional regulator
MTGRKFDKHYENLRAFYEDVYSHAVREVRPAGRTGAIMMLAEQDAGDWSDAPVPDLVIGQALHYPVPSRIDLGAGTFRTTPMRKGEFICAAPGAGTAIEVEGPHIIRITAVPYAELCALVGEDGGLPSDGDFGRLHAGTHWDRTMATLLERLWVESLAGNPYGSLWADGTLLQIAARLLRLRDGHVRATRGGLASWQLRRVTEYLVANLCQDVGLAELAAVAGLSPAHFSRAFKQATGRSPVQELIAIRMERAQELLADPKRPVIEVAALCGYESPSAFATVFRRRTGVTPTEWRRRL